MNISEKAIQRILNKTTDKRTVAKEAFAIVAPAQMEPKAAIEFQGQESVNFTPEVINEAPVTYETPDPLIDNEVLLNTPIEISASDKDRRKTAWAGTVPDKFDKRVKFVLDEAVDPNELHGKRNVNADIVIVSQLDPKKKDWVVKKVEILAVKK